MARVHSSAEDEGGRRAVASRSGRGERRLMTHGDGERSGVTQWSRSVVLHSTTQ
ncbi:hypothetical protein U1Q18_046725, partial [Sarracenia purpurea var. burkii]